MRIPKSRTTSSYADGSPTYGNSDVVDHPFNGNYVFALPARYNYAFSTGYQEVEEILKGNPLRAK